MEPLQYEKRGYLNEPFRLFHLADGDHQEIAYHYHTFHKIIILLAGRAGYAIEGEGYALQPGDYVLVGRGSIHRPIVEQGDFYERAILYISPEFLQELDRGFRDFFRRGEEELDKTEFLIPIFVDQLLQEGKISVRVLPTADRWFGVTYREDKPQVAEAFRALIAAGEYGADLFAGLCPV